MVATRLSNVWRWQHWPVVASLVVIAWLVVSVVGLALLLAGKEQIKAPMALQPSIVQPARTNEAAGQLAALNLMGRAVQASNNGVLTDTSLPLALKGIFMTQQAEMATALVQENGQPTPKLLHVGDSIAAGATLAAVEPARIQLRRGDGRLEMLRFAKTPSLLTPQTVAPTSTVVATAEPLPADTVQALLQYGLAPVGNGYAVQANASNRRLLSAGLQPGDVITKIDGRPVGNPLEDQAAMSALSQRHTSKIDYERQGKSASLELHF